MAFRIEIEVLYPLLAETHNKVITDSKVALGVLGSEVKIPTLSEAKATIKGMAEDCRHGYPNDLIVTAPEYVRLCQLVVNASGQLINMDLLKADLEQYDMV